MKISISHFCVKYSIGVYALEEYMKAIHLVKHTFQSVNIVNYYIHVIRFQLDLKSNIMDDSVLTKIQHYG